VDHGRRSAREIEVALYQLRARTTIHRANVPQRSCFLVRWSVGLFTRLDAAELADITEAFELGALRDAEALHAGTINSNFAVQTERGSWFVRVNEGKAEADVAWEAQLVVALAGRGVRTPPPLAARDGRRYAPLPGTAKWVSVFPWCPGRHIGPGEVTPALAGELGAALADLHHAGLDLPASWRRRSIYDHAHLVARYQQFAASRDPELAEAIDVVGAELAAAAAATAVRQRASHGIIHGDLFRDNVLWDGGRLVAILDFEQASGGSLAYDLAVCINDWCWDERSEVAGGGDPDGSAGGAGGLPRGIDGDIRIDLAAAVLAGYQRVRSLTLADREALVIEVRAAATRFTITRITDVYLAKVHNPDKDFRAFLARCHAWQGPKLGQLSSLL
jgi:homoserine kinase type II